MTHSRNISPIMLIAGFVCICAVLVSNSLPVQAQSRGGGRGATVELAPAEIDKSVSTTTLPASVIVENSHLVTSPLTGVIILSDIKAGSQVSAGDKLARLDVTDASHQLQLLQAQLAETALQKDQAKASLEFEKQLEVLVGESLALAQSRQSRASQLSQKGVVSAEAAETVASAVISAKQQIVSRRQAQTRLENQILLLDAATDRLRLQIDKLKADIASADVTAPVSGQLVSIIRDQSSYMRKGDKIAEIQNDNSFEISVDVPAELVPYLSTGMAVDASTPNGQKIKTSLRAILPQFDQRTATRAVRLTPLKNLPKSLAADGLRLTVQLPDRPTEPVVTIPKDALLPVDGSFIVFVAKDDVANRREVEIGGTSQGRVLVLSGVETGEMVVVKGNEGLSDGDALRASGGGRPKPEAPKAAKPGDDAVSWTLKWQTRRGEQTGNLVLSDAVNLYNGQPVEVVKEAGRLKFTGELTLPFGIIELKFDGEIDGAIMTGTVTLIGLPNGNEPVLDFQGKKDS